jgi:hypothetical protein
MVTARQDLLFIFYNQDRWEGHLLSLANEVLSVDQRSNNYGTVEDDPPHARQVDILVTPL